MAEKPGSVAIYGLSTEGYAIACALASLKRSTIIIDENLHMAMELKPEVASAYPSVKTLIEGEPLLALKSVDTSLSQSEYIFFTPKIRRPSSEVETEIGARLKEVSKYISKGSTLIYGLPTGIGGNLSVLSVIEKVSGLKLGDDFDYVYAPLTPGEKRLSVLGTMMTKRQKRLLEFLASISIKAPTPLSLSSAELLYSKSVSSKYVTIASEFEFQKKMMSREERSKMKKTTFKEFYVDDLCENLLDLKLLVSSVETGEPILYLASGSLKSVDGYIRYLIDELRSILRDKELKASKTRVMLVWTRDEFEMRGDKGHVIDDLVERLHDYIGDIMNVNMFEASAAQGLPLSAEKTNVIIACSQLDFKTLTSGASKLRAFSDNILLLKANLLVERFQR